MPARYASVNGITTAFDDYGEGDRVLVLIHGHPFDRSMWRPQATLADENWRVIAPDLRGYGESHVIPGKTTFDVFAADIAALLDYLGAGTAVIGGLSMGGQIAMEFCRLYPERVDGLTLAATFPRAETATGMASRIAAAERLLHEGMWSYALEALPRMIAPHNIRAMPAVAEHVLAMMRMAHPEGAAAALRGRAERPGYETTLAQLDVPALIVVGDDDAFTTSEDAAQMHDLLAGSELVRMQGVGHMPNLERPGAFNDAVRRLLARVLSRRRLYQPDTASSLGSRSS